jgi:hypothetical protein
MSEIFASRVIDKNHRDYVLGELLTNKEVEFNEPGTHPHLSLSSSEVKQRSRTIASDTLCWSRLRQTYGSPLILQIQIQILGEIQSRGIHCPDFSLVSRDSRFSHMIHDRPHDPPTVPKVVPLTTKFISIS